MYTPTVNRPSRGFAEIQSIGNGEATTFKGSLDELVRPALVNQPGAMHRLLVAAAPSVRYTCRGVLGAKHPDLEDTVQECLISILRSLPAYRFEAEFSHYLTKISLRVAIAARRRRKSEVQGLAMLGDLRQTSALPPTGEASDVLDNERTDVLRALIHQLPPEQSQALLLHFVLGYSLEETAEIAEVRVNTAKTRIRLAKDRLRKKIAQDPRASAILGRAPR